MKKYPTNPTRPIDEIISDVSENILELLKEQNIPLDQCVGVGIGFSGPIDRKQGTVIYSNNIKWKNVPLAKKIGEIIPCPVRVANDADCAALGEAIAGSGKNHSDVVMFTLGNGVGGGVILNGEVFEGDSIGGGEVGHQMIEINGRECSCGRKGCLEAYVSVPAFIHAASQFSDTEMSLKEIFDQYEHHNANMSEVIKHYNLILGQGIANIVNMFRSQLIILGGDMSDYIGKLIEAIKQVMIENCFGGDSGVIPEIVIAELGNNAGMIGAANL